jgi:hypothetical protein
MIIAPEASRRASGKFAGSLLARVISRTNVTFYVAFAQSAERIGSVSAAGEVFVLSQASVFTGTTTPRIFPRPMAPILPFKQRRPEGGFAWQPT